MTKLSDTQLVILSAAAQRPGRIALPLPSKLRGGAATKEVSAMTAKGLLEETDADKGEPLWRETGDGHGTTLVATVAGLAAIGIEPEDGASAPAGATVAASAGTAADTHVSINSTVVRLPQLSSMRRRFPLARGQRSRRRRVVGHFTRRLACAIATVLCRPASRRRQRRSSRREFD